MPEKWANIKKLTMQAKQKVAPLQANEAANIRRKAASFDLEQFNFREKFRNQASFFYDTRKPYDDIDDVFPLFKNIYNKIVKQLR